MKDKYMKYVDNLINEYDAFYFMNKYGDVKESTHPTEFTELQELLKKDEKSISALNWIRHQYDCYYRKELDKKENQDNAFNYLKQKIKEYEDENI